MQHKGTVTLETKRLILRRFTMDDLEDMYNNCFGDYEVWKWTCYDPMHSLADVVNVAQMFTEKWLSYERPSRYSWAIQLKSTGEVIGRFFGMHPNDELSEVELAYEMGRKWWNQGLMTEATKAVIDYFFCEVGFSRIFANHACANPASGRVMQKCGMTYRGIEPLGMKCNGGTYDRADYDIMAEEYFSRK